MDIKVGMYVRYNFLQYTRIDKIEKIVNISEYDDTVYELVQGTCILETDIISAGNSIGEILIVGDLLDKHQIVKIKRETAFLDDGYFIAFEDIEDLVEKIITKEHYDEIGYKVGE